MNTRIKTLRKQSLEAIESISAERALLITEFYQSKEAQELPVPVKRAKALYYFFQHKKICINPGELIVGERGPEPKATPTYPEISLHSLEDLEILDKRKKVSFKVNQEVKNAYSDKIIPYWKGKSNRDKLMDHLPEEWHQAYKAGIFTEFQEQRAPGHTVLGSKMFNSGLQELKEEIAEALTKLDFFGDPEALDKKEELQAMSIAIDAVLLFAERHANALEELAEKEHDTSRKAELKEMARVCRKVPAKKPETVHEMLQHYWFIHLGVISELNPWDSFNPGRLDQHLFPVYEKQLSENTINQEAAKELLQAFWIKFNNHPAPPKIGVTALESNTYTDFSLINVGGLKPDGSDAVNEMTYLILDVIEEMRLLQPSSMVQISKKNPDKLIHRALKIIKTGFGQPSLFNTDAIIQELLLQGKSLTDARNGGASGCVETGAFGTESYWLTGYFNLTKVLEITLNNGINPLTNEKTGIETGNAENFENFEQLMEAFHKQLKHFIDIKIKGNLIIERIFGKYLPAPFLSVLIEGCIDSGKDYNNGGAKYNTSYIQGVGLGSICDILTALKYHLFDKKTFKWKEVMQALDSDFIGFEEMQHQLIYHTPKYGNDNDYADQQAVEVFNMFLKAIDGRPTARGGKFRINMLPTTSHVYFGSVIGASADGRKALQPLSEGISPFQGTDMQGPGSVIRSAAKIDHLRTGGTLLNQKFSPEFFENEESYSKLSSLIRSYFKMDGHHIQFNVVTAETLKKAKKEPEKYKDLIVRVAGYSDYFNDLGEDLQDEIIRRTEHETL